MAIGDAVTQTMGAAATVRRPSSGVEEKITAIAKHATTDAVNIGGTGGNAVQLFASGVQTTLANPAATSLTRMQAFNMALMIDNSHAIGKEGTTNVIQLMGVQTNA